MSNQNAQCIHDVVAPSDLSATSIDTTILVSDTLIQKGLAWTLKQNKLLFNITLEKAEHKLYHRKRKTAAEKAGWVTSTLAARVRPAITVEEDEFISEIPTEVKTLATQFARLSQGVIAKIFSNCFRPINLYKLYLMKNRDDLYRNQIHIDDGILTMRKVTRSYKDYGTSNIFCSKAFLNYTMILMALFDPTISTFYLALAAFLREIIELSTIYKWQGGVLPLALDFHIHIIEG